LAEQSAIGRLDYLHGVGLDFSRGCEPILFQTAGFGIIITGESRSSIQGELNDNPMS
jgi:hypothetical protein